MTEKYNKKLGEYGEKLAVEFLNRRGYIIVEKNFMSRYGEIDIIAIQPNDPNIILCVEVKTRASSRFGVPEEAITRDKIKRLHDTACSYFFQNRIEGKFFRLDSISVFINRAAKKATIKQTIGIGYENY